MSLVEHIKVQPVCELVGEYKTLLLHDERNLTVTARGLCAEPQFACVESRQRGLDFAFKGSLCGVVIAGKFKEAYKLRAGFHRLKIEFSSFRGHFIFESHAVALSNEKAAVCGLAVRRIRAGCRVVYFESAFGRFVLNVLVVR